MTVHDIAKTERIEMYVKAVYSVSQWEPPVTIAKIADYMGVSSPSAYEMLKRLEAQGLLSPGTPQRGYRLTAQGLRTAERVVRRLRLAERLLTDILRLPLSEVYAEACKMEHVISPQVEERLADVLGHPAVCPHGLPIPGEVAPPLRPLPLERLDVWQRGVVASIPEEDQQVVAHLVAVGLVPGAELQLREVAPLDGPVTVLVGGQMRAIARELARRVSVRPS